MLILFFWCNELCVSICPLILMLLLSGSDYHGKLEQAWAGTFLEEKQQYRQEGEDWVLLIF